MWRVAVKNLGYAADAGLVEMLFEGVQEGPGFRPGFAWPPVQAHPGSDEGADEPGPDSALVIGTVAFVRVATVVTHICGVVARQASQPVWGDEFFVYHL